MPISPPSGKKIALMLESDGPGGAEHVLLHLAEGLRERGHTIVPVLRGVSRGKAWLQGQFRQRGIEPELFFIRSAIDWKCARGLMEIFRRRDVDIVHSHEFTMATYGALAARLTGRPHLITMHGTRTFAKRWRRRAALRWAIRNSIATVGVSRPTADFVESSLGLRAGAVGVVENGIVPQPGAREPIRTELAVASQVPLIIAVGNLYKVKGHIVLLRALASLASRRPDLPWQLAIAGRGEEEATLREFAEQQGLKARVHLLGFRTDVPNLLAAGDIWVMPSLSEGLPLSLLEAMFAGKAIVASRVGGIPDVVPDGAEALLSAPGDETALAAQLERVLADPDLRLRLGVAAQAHANRDYRLERTIDQYESLYALAPKR
ncbi:MAG: glycosyltransferase family 4 protein [Gemmatimonadota bacterium]